MSHALTDVHGRTMNYLRVSVTDRCNFRCVYCLPPEGVTFIPEKDLLTRDEIVRVARIFLAMGGQKLKLTGGEPLVRRDIVSLVAEISSLPGLADLGLTTNGYYLGDLAWPLKKAGLKRVNVSLDSFDPCRFAELTRCSGQAQVLNGIEAALVAGLKLKINVVALKGLSDVEIQDFALFAKSHAVDLRFIEFMPLCGTGWHPEWLLPLSELRQKLKSLLKLSPVPRGSATAEMYTIGGGLGRVGFIASMTEPFCGQCSRLRLSSDGKLRPCLFSNTEIDLKPALRDGGDDVMIEKLFTSAVLKKPIGHGLDAHVTDARDLPRIRTLGG